MQEIWKDIPNYEGLYQISNFGRIKKENKIYKNSLMNTGYYKITLTKNKKQKQHTLHRLVAEAFIPNPENKPCVNHKDGNKQNNHIDNLEWCTYSENEKHAYDMGLKKKHLYKKKRKNAIHSKKVIQYDKNNKFIRKWDCIIEAVEKLNISKTSISNCLNGRSKTAGRYIWKYCDDKKMT